MSKIEVKQIYNNGYIVRISVEKIQDNIKIVNRSIDVYLNPTGNCQLFSISNFYNLFSFFNTKKEFKSLISKIKKVCGLKKPYLLIDIKKLNRNKLRKSLSLLGEIEYKSYTNSNMTTLIIDLRK